MPRHRHHYLLALLVALLASPSGARAQDAFCTLTNVTTRGLSNGATIIVEADGMLQYNVITRGRRGREMLITLENVRSGLARDLIRPDNVYPISFISFTMSPEARNGIGLLMRIELVDEARFEIADQVDPQRLTINIRTDRAIPRTEANGQRPAEERKPEEKPDAEQALEVICTDEGLVTVRALKADIHRVVAELARVAGVNVAVDDAVKRKVSLNVTGLSVEQVLQGIASGYGLALSRVGDVEMLSEGIPTDLPTYGRSATTSYPLTYLKVDDAASLLPPFLIEYLRRNPQQNSIVVTAPRQMLEKIGQDLRSIDIAPPLIMVEVVAMEISHDGSGDAFLRWVYQGPDTEISVDTRTGDLRYAEGASYGIAGGVVDTETLSLRVRALVSSGSARIHAEPRMAAMNGEKASIFIGRDRFIRMVYGTGTDRQERIETVRVGVSLEITPWTGGNDEITSNVQCEVSNIVDIDPETGIPRLSTRRAEANVRARDGETIVIGGLLQRQQERTQRRVPILSELPLIGGLFRSSSHRTTETELVFFLTPRVIDPATADLIAAEALQELHGPFAVTDPAPARIITPDPATGSAVPEPPSEERGPDWRSRWPGRQ